MVAHGRRRKRNPQIILDTLPWGAPGWVGNGQFYSQDMANYVADFLQGAQKYHHLDIAYTGIWNERQFDSDYVKKLYRTLTQQGIPAKIVCCDEYPGEGLGQWSIVDTILKDPEVSAAVNAVGVHYSLVDGKYTTPSNARTIGKPLWSSEDQPNSGGGPILSREWQIGGRILPACITVTISRGASPKPRYGVLLLLTMTSWRRRIRV